MRLLNLRVPDALADLIERAAKAAADPGQEPNRSAWCREALEAGARRELRAAASAGQDSAVSTAGVRAPGSAGASGTGLLQPSGCQHPPPARRVNAEAEFCSLCKTVTRWLR